MLLGEVCSRQTTGLLESTQNSRACTVHSWCDDMETLGLERLGTHGAFEDPLACRSGFKSLLSHLAMVSAKFSAPAVGHLPVQCSGRGSQTQRA